MELCVNPKFIMVEIVFRIVVGSMYRLLEESATSICRI